MAKKIISPQKKGALLICASTVVFCVMASLIKSAAGVSPFKMILFRFIVGFGVLGMAAIYGKIHLKFVRSHMLLFRGATGGVAVFIYFLSITKLGLGKGSVFFFTYPVFVSVLSAIFLKETIRPLKWFFIASTFLGVYLLAAGKEMGFSGAPSIGIYELIAILGAILAGIAVVLIKKLHDTESTYGIFFAQCLVGFWIFLIPANVAPDPVSYKQGILLLCIGIVATLGQLLLTEGYRHARATTGSLLSMLTPVFNFLVGVAVFHESVTPLEAVGSAIVVISCALVLINDK